MNAEALQTQLAQLQQKVAKLLVQHRQLKQALQEANIERKQLRVQNEKQKEELKNFQNKIKTSKIVATIATTPQQNAAICQKIEEYVAEIDKCIAQLNQK
ncbi:hypothetical protein SAMN05421780_101687 [Flexibacter flexilis DSM 6793]|uniref:Uncharacterized protein n=1 Tax=Flexibacter flexilis DSM 6793 TaxID=927664 RepID=A0A1I1EA10_9BACT|nr:hypothetical protein [Flexibacter flexilis]SFB83422.1 hypothetical protein SAMN05421780_101687 [Flexibacter flexilis DSM 6793]